MILKLLTICALLAVSASARAQGNYHSAPLGGRSALLGGTGVALGADGAAPFLNPATIVRIGDRRIAFSARFFRLANRKFTDLNQPGPVDPAYGALELPDTSVSSTTLRTVPDTTCYFYGTTDGGKSRPNNLALCLGKVEESSFELTALSYRGESAGRRIDQNLSFREIWGAWSFGPTFALTITDNLTLGASVSLTRTRHETTANVSTVGQVLGTDDAVSSAYQWADSGSSWDGELQLGLQYRVSHRVTFGASIRAPSLHFGGSYRAVEDYRFSPSSTLAHSSGDGSFSVQRPWRLNVGVGAEYERLRVEANVFVHSGMTNFAHAELKRERVDAVDGSVTSRSTESVVLNESVSPVINTGVGAEYFVSRNLSLLGGVSSDFTALPSLADRARDARLFHNRFNRWHAGLGISSYTDYGDLVFGLRGDYSYGQLAVANPFVEPAQRDLISAREWALMLILAGRVSLTTLAEAATHVTQAVTGDSKAPGPRPPQPLRRPRRD